ncbi:MAG: hypothetical protein HYV28_07725 [Ignavibacteriales bacterium]|nr:hypothetical protein [Ignavibacteriales bacterium]
MRIPESTIQQVLHGSNIIDVVGQYVTLRAKGKNHWGVCPFHSEKTPSFSVNEDKQIFHCFGCHAGGNVFKFLMEYKRISYVEAIQELAAPLGIQIRYEEKADEKETSELDELLDLNEEVCTLFSTELFENTANKHALEYLTKRNLKEVSGSGMPLLTGCSCITIC